MKNELNNHEDIGGSPNVSGPVSGLPAQSAPSEARKKFAQKRMLIYTILFFSAAIVVVLVSFIPQIINSGRLADSQSQLAVKILEAEGARTRMEKLQDELSVLEARLGELERENGEMKSELDILRRQAAEASQGQANYENIIRYYEENYLRLEAKATAALAAAGLISAAARGGEIPPELIAHLDHPDVLALLSLDIRCEVEEIIRSTAG